MIKNKDWNTYFRIGGITVLALLLLAASAGAVPIEEWNRTFGGAYYDAAHSVQQTSDGGYVLAGFTESYGTRDADFWLIKTNATGNEQWNRTFGGTNVDSAKSVQQTSDGGYVLAGSTYSYGAGNSDFWLIKTNATGIEQWNRTFGGTNADSAESVQQTSDGGYVLAGFTDSYGAGSRDAWLIKTDVTGVEQWNKTFGGASYEIAFSVQQTSDGGYVLAGLTDSYGIEDGDAWLIKTDAAGNEQWNKTFGGASSEIALSVQQTSGGGYVLAGATMPHGYGEGDFLLIKTDATGIEQWNRTFGGGEAKGYAHSVQQTSDGGYVLTGDRDYRSDAWLIKTNAAGDEQWNRTFGGASSDYTYSVQQTSDGGYVLAGGTASYGAGSADFWLIKVAPEIIPSVSTTWTEQQKLTASDGKGYNFFGHLVSVDGDTIVVGAYNDDDGGLHAGSAYVFTRSGTTWTEQKLTASDAAEWDEFGISISIDGDTIVIGSGSDSAYVFTRSGTTWTQQQKLTAPDTSEGNFFGSSVSVDGDTIVVGANYDDDGRGSAYVFTRSGTTWIEQKLTASDAAEWDHFGNSVSVDGDTIVVSAYRDDDDGSGSGSAYVFTRSGTTWTQQQKLTASDAAAYGYFGRSVSVDGDTIVVGAYHDASEPGSVYVFTRSGTTWTEQKKLTVSYAAQDDWLGHSVSVDGDTIVVGAKGDDDDGTESGSVYVFTRSGTTWTQQQKLTASDAAAYDHFGLSVSVDKDTIVVGAQWEYDGGWHAGSAYVFTSPVTVVDIDIKPAIYPNSINLGSKQKAPVAILGSDTFNATNVDPLTVEVAGASVIIKNNQKPMSLIKDVNKDGYLDLIVRVSTVDLQLEEGDTEAELTGQTFDGILIKGTDTVNIVP